MATIVLLRNPLKPKERETFTHNGPIIDWLQEFAPKGFDSSISVYLNDFELDLDDLDIVVDKDDMVLVLVMPAAATVGYAILNALIAIAISYAISYIFAKDIRPPEFANQPEPNTTYSIAAQQNAARLGESIPVVYGSPIITPDYCSQPYTTYTKISLTAGTKKTVSMTFTNDWSGTETVISSGGTYEFWDDQGAATAPPTRFELGTRFTLSTPTLGFTGWYIIKPDVGPQFNTDYNSGGSITSVETENLLTNSDWESTEGEQYLYYFLCLGTGMVQLDKLLLGDHDITNSEFVQYRVYQPLSRFPGIERLPGQISGYFNAQVSGGPRFHENVITSLNFGGQELDDIGETEYFVLGTQPINQIEVDLNFQRGFFKTNSQGGFEYIRVDVLIKYRIAGSLAAPTTEKVVFVNDRLRNVSPVRRTIYFGVTAGIYEVSVERLTAAESTDGRASDALRIDGVRGNIVLGNTGVYSHTTLLVMRLKASEFSNSAATSRIRAKVTRTGLVHGADGSDNLTTNNPADIVNDIMQNTFYGAGRPEDEMDNALFKRLLPYWGGRTSATGFNAVFNQKTTVYEALKAALAVTAAEPMFVYGQVSANYSGLKPNRTQMFGLSNIVEGSLSIHYSWAKTGDPDGVQVEYRDPDTFQKEYETWPANANTTRSVSLFGCTNQTHASNYAKFLYNSQQYERQTVTFDTELEGLIPRPGDRIALSHDLASWGQSGLVISYDAATRELMLDEVPVFTTGDHFILLRNKDGTPSAPIKCTSAGTQTVKLDHAPPFAVTNQADDTETLYSFGPGTTQIKDLLVLSTEPSGNTVKISAINYDEQVFKNGLPFMGAALV